MKQFGFSILHKDKKTNARVGEITPPHGVVKTPAFVPVGTRGFVKFVGAHVLGIDIR